MRLLKVLCCLTIYLVFSQFFVKARATTNRSQQSDTSFCINEKIDTYEGKRGCWKMHTVAVFVESPTLSEPELLCDKNRKQYCSKSWEDLDEYDLFSKTHAPPRYTYNQYTHFYATEYVGVTLQLI